MRRVTRILASVAVVLTIASISIVLLPVLSSDVHRGLAAFQSRAVTAAGTARWRTLTTSSSGLHTML